MSRWRLKSYDQSPPGGFPFAQRYEHNGVKEVKQFPSLPLIEAQAQTVSAWRGGNSLPRASVKESLEDVDHYQCFRLGNNPIYCTCTDGATVALSQASPIVAPPCHGCGAPVQ